MTTDKCGCSADNITQTNTMNENERIYFRKLGIDTICELETNNGILASSREELFGFVFGRDSCITALKLLEANEKSSTTTFDPLVKKIIAGLAELAGKEINIESGEEPGKIVHDYREKGHELLTRDLEHPWYVYPDGVMRSFDSVDSTPLFLMTVARYLRQSGDDAFLTQILPSVRNALNWILVYGDKNADGLIDYRIHPDRKHGGLDVQNWMDHPETLFHDDGSAVVLPVAPLEVQAYVYSALRSWGDILKACDPEYAQKLHQRAVELRKIFNERFPIASEHDEYLASAIDGAGKQITAVRSTMGHVLYATWKKADGSLECILDEKLIPAVVNRLMQPDMFEPAAGIRTLSTISSHFSPERYHNGTVWPHDTSMVIEGLENFGYMKEAAMIREALLKAFAFYKTPIEIFVYDGTYREFNPSFRDPACRKQAWSAAAMVAETYS